MFVIVAVILAVTLIMALFPGITNAVLTFKSSSQDTGDQASTSVAFVNYEVVSPSLVRFDVLNTGRTAIPGPMIASTIVYADNATAPHTPIRYNASPGWTYTLTGTDANWDPGDTLTISVADPAGGFVAGDYDIKLILYNKATSEQEFRVA